jgi:short-subunit dehydrogenase
MKKVIIIGATSGLGLQLAKMYVSAGHAVGITGRRNELLEKFKNDFSHLNNSIVTACFDVTGKDNTFHIEKLVKELGGADLLIYNSGVGDVSPELDWSIDKKIVDTNVNGFIEIVNWAFRYFVRQGHGHIAATSSIASNRGNSFAPAYSASKAFISCYLEGLHLKALKLKIPVFVTDIQPGFIKTKEINLKGLFWVMTVEKAAGQIFNALEKRRFRVYVSKRWGIIALLMRWAPEFVYRRIG